SVAGEDQVGGRALSDGEAGRQGLGQVAASDELRPAGGAREVEVAPAGGAAGAAGPADGVVGEGVNVRDVGRAEELEEAFAAAALDGAEAEARYLLGGERGHEAFGEERKPGVADADVTALAARPDVADDQG